MATDEIRFLSAVAENAIPVDIKRLIDIISGLTVGNDQELSSDGVSAAFDILQRLYPRAEASVRRLLSERLAARGDVPHSLLLLLANDAIDISGPLIRKNPGLAEDDLVSIITNGTRGHRLAVCERETLTATISDVLAYLGDPEVMLALVKNPGAELSDSTMRRLVVASRNIEALHQPLLQRRELSQNLAAVMYHWVSESLRRFISKTFGDAVAKQVGGELAQSVGDGYRAEIMQRSDNEADEPSWVTILVALRAGNFSRAEKLLQALTELPTQSVEMVMYHDDGRGMAVLCRAFNGSRMMFSELYDRLHGSAIFGSPESNRNRSAALAAFNDTDQLRAAEILHKWRENPKSVWGNPLLTNIAFRQRKLEASAP